MQAKSSKRTVGGNAASPARRRVLILEQPAHSSSRDKLRGALRFASERGWEVRIGSGEASAEKVRDLVEIGWPDAVLRLSYVPARWRFAGPAVNVEWSPERLPELPGAVMLVCETAAEQRAVAEALVRHGYRRFVWSSFPGNPAAPGRDWPDVRQRFLGMALRERGIELETAPTFGGLVPTAPEQKALRKFFSALSPDTVVITANDGWGSSLVRLAVEWGFSIPGDFSVVGFDNDRDACETMEPRLSSFDPHFEAAGYEGARLLQRMLDGDPAGPAAGDVVAAPLPEFIERGSTLRGAPPTVSRRVSQALAFLRKNAAGPITAETVAEHMGLTRQRAGALFREQTGKSIAQQIAAERVLLLQKALKETNLSLSDVCGLMPFSEEAYVRTFFRRETGFTMGEWRRRHRR